jgi:hypothetical protein
MIVFQSPAIAKSASYQPCHSPSPGGSNERSECRFVCCSGVGRDEGELNLRERSERHSYVIQKCQNVVLKAHTCPRQANYTAPAASCLFKRLHSSFPKAIQGYSSPFNPIQGVFEKDIFFLCGLDGLVVSNPRNPRFRPLPAQAGRKADRFKPMQGKKLL